MAIDFIPEIESRKAKIDFEPEEEKKIDFQPESDELEPTPKGNQVIRTFMQGLAELNAGIARVPAAAYDLAAVPQNLFFKTMGSPEKQVQSPDWLMNNPIAKYFDRSAQADNFIYEKWRGESFEEILKRDKSEAVQYITLQVVRNAPTQLALLTSAGVGYSGQGLAAMGTIAGTQKLREHREKGVDPITAVYDAVNTGSIEAITEMFGTIRVFKNLIGQTAKAVGKKTAFDITKQVGKNIFKSAVEEGTEEVAAEFGQSMSSKMTGADPDALKGLGWRMVESGLIGAAAGGGMTAPIGTYQGLAESVDQRKAEVATEQTNDALRQDLKLFLEQNPEEVKNMTPEQKRSTDDFLTKKTGYEDFAEVMEATTEKIPKKRKPGEVIEDELNLIKAANIDSAVLSEKMLEKDTGAKLREISESSISDEAKIEATKSLFKEPIQPKVEKAKQPPQDLLEERVYSGREVNSINQDSVVDPEEKYTLREISIDKTDLAQDNLLSREALFEAKGEEDSRLVLEELEEGGDIPSIVVKEKNPGLFIVEDGHHRLVNLVEQGKKTVTAFVQKTVTKKPKLLVEPAEPKAVDITAKDLVESKSQEEITKKLETIFGTHETLSKIDEGLLPVTREWEVANEYMADIEHAAIERNFDETELLLNEAEKELKIGVQEKPGEDIIQPTRGVPDELPTEPKEITKEVPKEIIPESEIKARPVDIPEGRKAEAGSYKKTPNPKEKLGQLDLPATEENLHPDSKSAEIDYETQKDLWIGETDVRVHRSKIEKSRFQQKIKDALGLKKYTEQAKAHDQAIQIYIDSKRSPGDVAKYYNDLTPEQKKIVDLSQNLPDDMKAIADDIRNSARATGLEAQDMDIITNVLDNYVPRIWDIEKKAQTEAFRKFGTTSRHAKQRKFGTIVEGWAVGFKLKVTGATNNLQILKEEMVKTIEDKKFISSLKKMKTIDGNPMLTIQQLEGYEKVEHPNFKTWKHAGKADPNEAYGRNFFVTEDGNIFERRDLYAPKIMAKNLNNILGISKLKGIAAIDFATKYNAIFKAWILQTSLFHHMAFMRSYYFGTNHKTWKEMNIIFAYKNGLKQIKEESPLIELGIRSGLTLGIRQDWEESLLQEKTGIGKLIDKIPGARFVKDPILKLRQNQADFLFGEFGAGLKAQSFIIEYRNLTKKHPNLSADKAAKLAANLINDDFGGLHLKRIGKIGRNPTVQHIFRLFALAPDWTESNIRTMAKVIGAGGKVERDFYRRFWTGVLYKGIGITVLANYLMAGFDEDDEDAKGINERFLRNYKRAWAEGRMRWTGVDITPVFKAAGGKTSKRKYFAPLGHFTDVLKFMIHPIRSAHHKGSVIYSILYEAMSGKDWAGRSFTTLEELLTEGKTVKYRYGGKSSGLDYSQLPSYVLAQALGVQPVQVQNLIAWIVGEMDGFDATANSMGLGVRTTFRLTPEEKAAEALKLSRETKDSKERMKQLRNYAKFKNQATKERIKKRRN